MEHGALLPDLQSRSVPRPFHSFIVKWAGNHEPQIAKSGAQITHPRPAS
jgi:hypothetical protein